jgi:hypothetical protein
MTCLIAPQSAGQLHVTAIRRGMPKALAAAKSLVFQYGRHGLWALLFFLIAFGLQCKNGAYNAGFGSYPDEPAHYVTGLMVYRYLTTALGSNPMTFAERFYAHYPVVAFGHWPPLFYVIQALWGLLAGGLSRASALILIAALTSIISTVVYGAIGSRFGQLYGLVFGTLFATTPIVQVYTSSIMAEMPLTLFTFAATLAFARLLLAPGVARAIWFGVCLFCAICVKGDGWALMALPLVVPILTGSPSSLLRKHLWVPTICVFSCCTLMTLLTLNMVTEALLESSRGFAHLRSALPSLLGHQFTIIGIPLAICACLGIFITVIWPLFNRGPVNTVAACNFTLLGSVILLHAVVPVNPEPRYLCMSIPSFLMFAAAGLNVCAGWLFPRVAILRSSCPLVVGALITFSHIGHPHFAPHVNMAPFAQQVLDRAVLARSALLVATTESHECEELSFVAEVASLEGGNFQHAVIRAGKLIADSSWLGSHYQLLYSDPGQALAVVEAIPISVIVLYTGPGTATSHCQVLHRMVDANSTKWSLVRAEETYQGRIEFFVATPLPTRAVRLPSINLRRSLGRDISAEF